MNKFRRLLAPIWRRIDQLFSLASGVRVNSRTRIQQLQLELLQEQLLDAVPHLEGYGRTAHPPKGYEALVASLAGERRRSVCLTTFHRQYRLKELAEGEVALYDDLGNVVHLKRDRLQVKAVQHLEVSAPTCEITATTTHIGDVTIDGNLIVSGTIAAAGAVTSQELLSAPSVAAADSLQVAGKEVLGHKHGQVASGNKVSGEMQ